jgi:hypothetical protein
VDAIPMKFCDRPIRGVDWTEYALARNIIVLEPPSLGSKPPQDRVGKPAAYVLSTCEHCGYSLNQFTTNVLLDNVPCRTRAECGFDDIGRRLLADEKYLRWREKRLDLSSRFDTIQLRKADIQQDHVWLQFCRFLNRFHSVGCCTNDLPAGSLLDDALQLASGRFEIVDNEDASRCQNHMTV